jgi:hypothetical protein
LACFSAIYQSAGSARHWAHHTSVKFPAACRSNMLSMWSSTQTRILSRTVTCLTSQNLTSRPNYGEVGGVYTEDLASRPNYGEVYTETQKQYRHFF